MGAHAWLEFADNAEAWARLRRALEFSTRFSLLLVLVANLETEALAVDALLPLAGELERVPILLDARGLDADAPVRRLLGDTDEQPLALLTTLASVSEDREAFERCFVQLNARRDQIAARLDGPLVVFVRLDALRWLISIAPDLFSVHTAQFHLSSPRDTGRPAWLMLPHEEFGLLGVGEAFAAPSIGGMPNYLEPIPEVPSLLIGREAELNLFRAAMARNLGTIRVWGARGIGKSSVIATVVREFERHYERVLWIHGWAAHTVSAVLGAIVRALDEQGRCPADPVDIEARYRELTRVRRVLIVVELTGSPDSDVAQLDFASPASGSLLVEEASSGTSSADATIEIGPLDPEHARALWVARTHSQMSVPLVETGCPGVIELGARLWRSRPDMKPQLEEWSISRCDDLLDLANLYGPNPSQRQWWLEEWSHFSPSLPKRFVERGPAEEGVLQIDSEVVRFVAQPDCSFDFVGRPKLLDAVGRAQQCPASDFTSTELEFVRRGLRLYTREWASEADQTELEAREHWIADWRTAPESLTVQALASLPVDERAEFAIDLAAIRHLDGPVNWIRRAVAAAIASGQLERARRLLSSAAEPPNRLDPVWLADTKFYLALMPPTQLDHAALARILFETEMVIATAHGDAAVLARVRYGLSHDGDVEPPAIRALAEALSTDTPEPFPIDDLARQTAHPDLYPHFAHAHLCILSLNRADWREAKHHLDLATDTAHAWGLAVPLLRAHLLALEYALATGDLEPATIDLDATLTRCDQVLGPLHLGTLAALTLALRIRDGLGQFDAARSLAEECRRRLRYTNPDATILARLLKFYEQHGPADVAAGLRARMS